LTIRTNPVPSADPGRSTCTSMPGPGEAPRSPTISQTRSTEASIDRVSRRRFTTRDLVRSTSHQEEKASSPVGHRPMGMNDLNQRSDSAAHPEWVMFVSGAWA
jgi:hypothetical protein